VLLIMAESEPGFIFIVCGRLHGEDEAQNEEVVATGPEAAQLTYLHIVLNKKNGEHDPDLKFEEGVAYLDDTFGPYDANLTDEELEEQLSMLEEQDCPVSAVHVKAVMEGTERPDVWLILDIFDSRKG